MKLHRIMEYCLSGFKGENPMVCGNLDFTSHNAEQFPEIMGFSVKSEVRTEMLGKSGINFCYCRIFDFAEFIYMHYIHRYIKLKICYIVLYILYNKNAVKSIYKLF